MSLCQAGRRGGTLWTIPIDPEGPLFWKVEHSVAGNGAVACSGFYILDAWTYMDLTGFKARLNWNLTFFCICTYFSFFHIWEASRSPVPSHSLMSSFLFSCLSTNPASPLIPPTSTVWSWLAMDQQHELLGSSPNSHYSSNAMATTLAGMTINDHHHGNQFHKENGIAVGHMGPGDGPMKGEATAVEFSLNKINKRSLAELTTRQRLLGKSRNRMWHSYITVVCQKSGDTLPFLGYYLAFMNTFQ